MPHRTATRSLRPAWAAWLGTAALMLALAAGSASAANGGASTVISLGGGVWWKAQASDEWRKLTMDVTLAPDAWVKTEADGFVRLAVAPDGHLTQIAAGKEGTLESLLRQAPAPAAKSSVFTALSELFSGASQERKAVSYAPKKSGGFSVGLGGAAAPPAAPPPAAAAPAQPSDAWLEMVRKPALDRSDVEPMLKAASEHSDRAVQNRAVALLTRLALAFPDDAALRGLAGQVVAGWGTPGSVHLLRRHNDKTKSIDPGDKLAQDDRIRIEYRAESESYPVLFDLTQAKKGKVERERLFPAGSAPPQAVAANTPVPLPKADGYFKISSGSRAEVVLAWVCAAPPPEAALAAAVDAAAQAVAGGNAPDAAALPAVPYCPQVIVQRYPVK